MFENLDWDFEWSEVWVFRYVWQVDWMNHIYMMYVILVIACDLTFVVESAEYNRKLILSGAIQDPNQNLKS